MQKKHTGGFVPLLCNIIGILMILAVIVIVIPLAVPGLLGYQSFHVESGSMEPEIPVDSVVYVRNIAPQDIRANDIIAFYQDETVITHRVRENRIVEGEFITRGDANPVDDINRVPYASLVGRAEYHLPFLGAALKVVATGIGKVYLLLFAACGVLFNILASRIRYSRRLKQKEERRRAAREAEKARATAEKEERLMQEAAREGRSSFPERNGSGAAGKTPSGYKGNPPRKRHPVRTAFMVILLIIFLGAAAGAGMALWQYHVSDEVYRTAKDQFVKKTVTVKETPGDRIPSWLRPDSTQPDSTQPDSAQPNPDNRNPEGQEAGDPTRDLNPDGQEYSGQPAVQDPPDYEGQEIYTTEEGLTPQIRAQYVRDLDPSLLQKEKKFIRDKRLLSPIAVDFKELKAVNEDVRGWIYCQDTNINYPVLHGETNDTYLRHTYDRAYNIAGSIFMETDNDPDFKDQNTIIYGHHMNDGSMFAGLDEWAEQEYYEKHPVFWLLTPERDYLVVLAAGYHTSAYSDAYTIFREPGEDFTAYILDFLSKSDFKTNLLLPLDGHYIMLSTCAYIFDNARYVLHGLLVPADSAGGRPIW